MQYAFNDAAISPPTVSRYIKYLSRRSLQSPQSAVSTVIVSSEESAPPHFSYQKVRNI